ncbi:MAG: hypothetical protein P8X74_01240 [Reinekea sp.]
MNHNRLMPLILASAIVAGCAPEANIGIKSAETVLSVNSRINQVARLTAKGFTNTRINNPTLQPFLTTGSANTLTGSCKNEHGSYLFSKSDESGQFSLAFEQCEGTDGGVVDGTLNGHFASEGNSYSTNASGSLTTNQGDVAVDMHGLELSLEFNLDNGSFFISQSGDYNIRSRHYKGTVSVNTQKPVGIDTQSLMADGVVSYRDLSGNVIRAEHTNNGIHLYLNQGYYTTYGLEHWAD